MKHDTMCKNDVFKPGQAAQRLESCIVFQTACLCFFCCTKSEGHSSDTATQVKGATIPQMQQAFNTGNVLVISGAQTTL